ncbi:MAG: hypothetical protein AAF628_32940 [Planctomycetota bacterium]
MGHPVATRPLRPLDLAALGVLLALLAGLHAAQRGAMVDDAFIVLRYAHQLLTGEGWVFNPGDRFNASTSPLNTLVVTLIGGALGDLELAARISFAAAHAGTVAIAFALFRPRGVATASVAGLLVTLQPLLLRAVGLETALLQLSALGSVAAHVRRRPRTTGVLLGLTCLCRADGALLALLLAAHHSWRRRRDGARRAALDLVPMAAAGAAVLVPWALYASVAFDSLLPSTLAAKQAQMAGGVWPAERGYAPGIALSFGVLDARGVGLQPWHWCTLLLGGAVVAVVRRRAHPGVALVAAWAAAQAVAYTALGVPFYYWYYAPLHLALALGAATCFDALWHANAAPNRFMRTGATAAVLGLAWVVAPSPRPHPPHRYPHYHAAAAWLRQNAPAGSTVACAEIGVIGYRAPGLRVLDMFGLVSPAGVARVRCGDTAWWLEAAPDYIVLHAPPWQHFERPALATPAFADRYQERPAGIPGARIFARTAPAAPHDG